MRSLSQRTESLWSMSLLSDIGLRLYLLGKRQEHFQILITQGNMENRRNYIWEVVAYAYRMYKELVDCYCELCFRRQFIFVGV